MWRERVRERERERERERLWTVTGGCELAYAGYTHTHTQAMQNTICKKMPRQTDRQTDRQTHT